MVVKANWCDRMIGICSFLLLLLRLLISMPDILCATRYGTFRTRDILALKVITYVIHRLVII